MNKSTKAILLTEAAQSTNAEANMLVEDPEPQVLRDAEKFFTYYFDSAPTLRRKDVEAYKNRVIQKKGKIPAGTTKEDELPSPPQRKHELVEVKPNNVWKISSGKDARYWDEWVQAIDEDEEGIVAIGWNETGSLDNFKSYEALREMVAQKAEEIWNKEWDTTTNVKYATDQLWAFRNNIKKGDALIVYSESRVLGVAEVTAESKYRYEKAGPISYAHQINVKYKWYKQWPQRADQRIIDTLGKQGTLRLVEEGWLWDHLINKLP